MDIYCEFDAETVESSLNLIWAPVAESILQYFLKITQTLTNKRFFIYIDPNALHPILLEDQPLRTSSSLPDIDVLFGFMSAVSINYV